MHLINYKIFYFISEFNSEHILKLRKNINLIFRNYEKKFDVSYYKKIKNFCHSNGYKIYLSNNVNFAHNLGFDGVYIPAFNKRIDVIKSKLHKLILLGSAHNIKEINEKKKQGMDLIFLAPIFRVKKRNTHLGIIRFNNFSKLNNNNFVALGGINKSNINKIRSLNCYGIASISYIKGKIEKSL